MEVNIANVMAFQPFKFDVLQSIQLGRRNVICASQSASQTENEKEDAGI